MKKLFSFSVIFLLASIFVIDSYAQSFYTGGIGVNLNNFGRVRVFSDNQVTRQVDRSSVLVGVSASAVFDYTQDAGTVLAATTVGSPLFSDFEVTGTIDNSDSNLPPNVEVLINIYGWTNGTYLLAKMNIKNNESTSIPAVIGIEILPQVDGAYGGETVQWNAASQTVLMNKTGWVGYKFFSAPQTALKSINWTSGYGTDALFYQWLTQNSYDPPLTAGVDGAVAILGQAPINIAAGQSVDFYFGISLGTSQSNCLSNMDACLVKYNQIVPVELTSFTANSNGNTVELNWTTASELNNQGFEIERKTSSDLDWVLLGFKEGKGTTTESQSYSYLDNVSSLEKGTVSYRLKQIDFGGNYSYSDEVEVDVNPAPNQFELNQNYPNPFNPSTTISFGVPFSSQVTLKIYNTLGEEVAELVNQNLSAGSYSYSFDAAVLPSGIYVYTLQAGEKFISKKMTLIK
ncbi:MAG TPA: T9SS type A sorting domain-containing protein [Ignavibacteriaceae bacterium]|nr:T9SS type A sorting domain-containing protein [Ignavibacteriaceae bacterium]